MTETKTREQQSAESQAACDDNMAEQQAEAADNMAEPSIEEQLAAWHDKYLRLQAEFDNFRKRIEPLREGEMLVVKKFEDMLTKYDVHEMECTDRPFDADRQEAVARFAAGEEKSGLVIDVVQRGYMRGEKVLRYAKVVVGE